MVIISIIIAILVDTKWYPIVILICSSLMTNDTENLWRNVYSNPLPITNILL